MPNVGQMAGGGNIGDEGEPDPKDEAIAYEAEIINSPAIDEGAFVIIPNFDPNLKWGPCPWSPRIVSAAEYGTPTQGDRALVMISDEKEPWILEWWPYES